MSEPTPLRDRLIGAWDLLSFSGRTPSGKTFYPMGPKATGRLLYSADGQVAVSLAEADRTRPDPDTRMPLLNDAAAGPIARTYLAYAGPFTFDETTHIVTHTFELCLDPARVGTLQERLVTFHDDDRLELSVAAYRGEPLATPLALLWERCRPGAS